MVDILFYLITYFKSMSSVCVRERGNNEREARDEGLWLHPTHSLKNYLFFNKNVSVQAILEQIKRKYVSENCDDFIDVRKISLSHIQPDQTMEISLF